MAMNGSGVRDTSRVLGISQNTVIRTLKNSILHR
jgi:transposase-like protein